MILTASKIQEKVSSGQIIIDPFVLKRLNPNSYDFCLGSTLKIYKETCLDARKNNEVLEVKIPDDGYILQPDKIYLGHTMEKMGSNYYVPIIRGKSSTGRLGIFIHITADLIDIGSVNQWTLMLHAVQPVRVYPGMRIGQVTFWEVMGDIILYKGKYQGSIGPMESLSYQDINRV